MKGFYRPIFFPLNIKTSELVKSGLVVDDNLISPLNDCFEIISEYLALEIICNSVNTT